jgi:ABC-type anion transport system duplicated permease subunit
MYPWVKYINSVVITDRERDIVLLNAGPVPTVWYIFFHFIIGYEQNTAGLQLLKKNMVVIVFRN